MIDTYLYVCLIGAAGGVNAFLWRLRAGGGGKTPLRMAGDILMYVLMGIFAGWIVFEISEYFTDRFKIRLAAAGIAAFGGEEILLSLNKRLSKEIER
jgi:hypothetical protein